MYSQEAHRLNGPDIGRYLRVITELSVTAIKDGIEFSEETATSQNHRQKTLSRQLTADRRKAKLDKYFSAHPPNGRLIDIYRGCLKAFRRRRLFPVQYYGQPPAWLDWPAVFDSIKRLEKKGVLTVTITEGIKGTKIYQSTSNMQIRQRRDARTNELVTRLRGELADSLAHPLPNLGNTIHGCQLVYGNHWQVRLYLAGRIRSFGTYDFSTAVRLADAINLHFSSYRRPGKYNISESHAKAIIADLPAVATFLTDLEAHWLATGVIGKPAVDPIAALEARIACLERKLASVLRFSP